ncbi:helix-turn-helix domain-containing protein [Halobacteriales archaeon Cl-PHB]
MLTAKVCVRFEGDWTEELRRYDVFGEFLASTFRNRRYIGLMSLETDDLEATCDVIRNHRDIESVDVLETYESADPSRTAATLFLQGQLSQFSPLQTLMYEGFLPLGPTKLEDGQECFDLLLEDREELSVATELLEEFGDVHIERISQEFRREITPSSAEWQELLSSFPERRRQLLDLAIEEGYYDIPREVTLAELAAELDITKTTASNHLRKAEQQVMKFLIPYIDLAATD